MDSLHLHTLWTSDVTLIPNGFLDEYMPRANGEFVKIYLYLLRSAPGDLPSLSLLADKMDCTERDILRAIRYWEKEGLLLLGFDDEQKLVDISFRFPEKSPPELDAMSDDPADCTPAVPPENALTAERIRELKENEEIVQLLYIAEQYLSRPLTSTDTNKILYFYENLKFDPELIEFLIEHCVSKNHRSIRYIEKVALSWAEQNISTVAAAKEETRQYSKTYFTIFKALGIQNRNPVNSEIEMMNCWMQEWGFTMDLIQEACKRTVLQTGTGSLLYTDKILKEWHAAKVHHLADLESLDADQKSKTAKPAAKNPVKPNRFNDYPHRDYDFEQIKKSMFNQ